MNKLFPIMYNRPEKTMSLAAIIYGVICFYTLPFLALLFSGGFTDPAALSWFEIVYHVVNFLVAFSLFRPYLVEAFEEVRYNLQHFALVVAVGAAVMLVYALALLVPALYGGSDSSLFYALGTLPLAEMELFNQSSNLVMVNPIVGTICIVFLTPVTISCIYYASTFAPICNDHPWLAYIAVTLLLAIPRALNALTFWPVDEETMLYLAQLPVHLIACYTYHLTDTVWAPICTISAANAAFSLLSFLIF